MKQSAKPIILVENINENSLLRVSQGKITTSLEYEVVTPKNLLIQSASIKILGDTTEAAICSINSSKTNDTYNGRFTGSLWGIQCDISLDPDLPQYEELFVYLTVFCRSHNEDELLEYTVAVPSLKPLESKLICEDDEWINQ